MIPRAVEPAVGQKWKIVKQPFNAAYAVGREFTIRHIDAVYYEIEWEVDGGAYGGGKTGNFRKERFKGYCELVHAGAPAAKQDASRHPHTCPRCSAPSYNGGGPADIDCTNTSCPTKTMGKIARAA